MRQHKPLQSEAQVQCPNIMLYYLQTRGQKVLMNLELAGFQHSLNILCRSCCIVFITPIQLFVVGYMRGTLGL